MKSLVNDLLDEKLGGQGTFAAARGVLLNPRDATLRKAASPQAHGFGAAEKLSSDFLVEQSGSGE